MMNKLLLGFALLLLSFNLKAFDLDAIAISVDKDVELIIEKGGIRESLAAFPQQIESQLLQRAAKNSAEISARERKIADALKASFNLETVMADFKDNIKRNATADELNSIAQWLKTPLAIRLVQAELRMTKPGAEAELLRFAADMQGNPPAQTRIDLMIRLEKSAQMTDVTIAFIEALTIGFITSMNAGNTDNPVNTLEVKDEFEKIRPMMREMLWQQHILTSHYMYQDISNDDLEAYITFYESRLGRMYMNLLVGGFVESIGNFFASAAPAIKLIE